MEMLLFVLAWPLLIFFIGFLVIAFYGAFITAGAALTSQVLGLPIVIIILLYVVARSQQKTAKQTPIMQSQIAQSFVVSLSVGLLVPLFVHELLRASGKNLASMIVALLFGFGLMAWGMFMKDNSTLRRANLIGSVLTIIYCYTQLWQLPVPSAKVIASAIGLVAAITIGIIRFKDKLI